MSGYFLLCNYTDQGVRKLRDAPNRRAAARDLAKKLGVELRAGYMALGTYDLIIHAEAPSDQVITQFALSLALKGNLRTTTVRVFSEAEVDQMVATLP